MLFHGPRTASTIGAWLPVCNCLQRSLASRYRAPLVFGDQLKRSKAVGKPIAAKSDAASNTKVSDDQPSIDDDHTVTRNLSSISDLSDLFHRADING